MSHDATSHGVPTETTGLCPQCLERVPARYEVTDGSVHLSRSCPDHGETTREVWADAEHWEWVHGLAGRSAPDPDPEAAFVVDHDHACLAVIEVTEDCNLSCSYCFASSGPGGDHRPFEEVVDLLDTARTGGDPRPIQLSGGEPTVRDDLPEIVERAREMGFDHVQVNTNGVRIATEDGYADRLAAAGVTAVYLQFDGLTSATYEAIREVDLVDEKHAAVEACRDAGLPVVLVPTVVPETNDHEMGDIVRFGLDNLDVVQSVNFQPVAHFGRYAESEGRFSLDEAGRRLADQLPGLEPRDLLPIPCCSATCQTATAVSADGDGGVEPVTRFVDRDLFDAISGRIDESDWLDLLANRSGDDGGCCPGSGCCGGDALPLDVDALLDDLLPVSFTGFMDADAGDAEKLSNCCVSVPTPDGDLVPFCAYNMTTTDGRYAIRNRNGWGGRAGVGAPSHGEKPDSEEVPGE